MAIKENSKLPQTSLQYIHGICSELILAVGRSRGVVRAICSAEPGRRLEYSRRGCAAPSSRAFSHPRSLSRLAWSSFRSPIAPPAIEGPARSRPTCDITLPTRKTLAGSTFCPQSYDLLHGVLLASHLALSVSRAARSRDSYPAPARGPENRGPPSMVSNTNVYERYSMLESTFPFRNNS
jgi:hypothetical protein